MNKYVVVVSNKSGVTGCWVANASLDMAEKASHHIAAMISDGKGFTLASLSSRNKVSVPGSYVSQHAWKVAIVDQDTGEEV